MASFRLRPPGRSVGRLHRWFFALSAALFLLAGAHSSSAVAAATPVLLTKQQAKIHISRSRFDHATGYWKATATLINRSRRSFYEPILLEVSKIEPKGFALRNALGLSPRGYPWVAVALPSREWAPGCSVTTTLVFAGPTRWRHDREIEFRGAVYAALSAGNTPPIADAGPDRTFPRGATVTLDGSGSADPDGNPITYAWSLLSAPAGSLAVLSDPSLVNPQITLDKAGDYVIGLIVNDGAINSPQDTVTLSTSNTAPVANAGPDGTGKVGTVVQLDGGASSDVDGDPLTFQWTLLDAPAGSDAALVGPTTVHPTLALTKPGAYLAQLIVNDGKADSEPDNVTISTVNTAPVANAGQDATAKAGDTVPLNGSGSTDVDGDAWTYRWSIVSQPSGNEALLSDPTTVTPTVTVYTRGTYVIQLIVNDGATDSLPDTMTVTTENSPPVANAGLDRAGAVGETLTLDGTGSSDADNDPLTYRWSILNQPGPVQTAFDDPTLESPQI